MKVIGIVLILAGIAMLLFKGFSYTQQKKVVDLGPVAISKTEKKRVNWPLYAGVLVTVAGVVITVSAKK